MRLLHVKTQKFQYWGRNPPPYAIASHRWITEAGKPEEVVYNELDRHKKYNSPGYKKVMGFCSAVRRIRPNLEWLWIDSCCINKRDLAETIFSINSMYAWYSQAEICIAYLDDVDSDGSNFSQSIWFKRGWTLQELIAPRMIVFMSRDWQTIGHKCRYNGSTGDDEGDTLGPLLNRKISEITGISLRVLKGTQPLYNVPMAEKLEWSRGRETTMPEDKYYALQGILGISVTVNYGRGEEIAWIDFQAAVDHCVRFGGCQPLPLKIPPHLMPQNAGKPEERDLQPHVPSNVVPVGANAPSRPVLLTRMSMQYPTRGATTPGVPALPTGTSMHHPRSGAPIPQDTGRQRSMPGDSTPSGVTRTQVSQPSAQSVQVSSRRQVTRQPDPQNRPPPPDQSAGHTNPYVNQWFADRVTGEPYCIVEEGELLRKVFRSGRRGETCTNPHWKRTPGSTATGQAVRTAATGRSAIETGSEEEDGGEEEDSGEGGYSSDDAVHSD